MRLRVLLWGWILLTSLLIPSILAPCQASHNSAAGPEREFEAAMAAQDRGDLDRAETLLYELHRAHPGIFAVDESLGLLLASRGRAARALPLLESAVREQPSSDVAHANLGAALYQLHRSQSALGEFERAVSINPRNSAAQQSLGRLYMDGHRPEEAATAFLAAQRLKPGDMNLKLDCVTALLAANRLDAARSMLSTVADADKSARAQSLSGEIDEKDGKFQSAGLHFNRALQLDPSEGNAWQLGDELLKHWSFSAAITVFDAASAKFPDSKRVRVGLGAALFGAAQYEKAVPVFAGLLARNPDNSMYAELLGIACNAPLRISDPRCSQLMTYSKSHPADARAATYAATSLLATSDEKNMEIAKRLLQRAIQADPSLPEAQFQMGMILQDERDWNSSIPWLERAVRLKPELAQAHYRLALAYQRIGRRTDAKAQISLYKKFAGQEQANMTRRLNEVTRFAGESSQ